MVHTLPQIAAGLTPEADRVLVSTSGKEGMGGIRCTPQLHRDPCGSSSRQGMLNKTGLQESGLISAQCRDEAAFGVPCHRRLGKYQQKAVFHSKIPLEPDKSGNYTGCVVASQALVF